MSNTRYAPTEAQMKKPLFYTLADDAAYVITADTDKPITAENIIEHTRGQVKRVLSPKEVVEFEAYVTENISDFQGVY